MTRHISLFFLFVCLLACKQEKKVSQEISTEDLEAREDSLELVKAYADRSKILPAVTAANETTLIKAATEEDAADDPAIWVHPTDPSKSLIYGSNKQGGIAVYNLDGEEVDYYPIGKINNIDILKSYQLGDKVVELLGCSNRTEQSINLFTIDASSGKLTNAAASILKMDKKMIDDVYGFCFGRDLKAKKPYVFINGKNGVMQQFELQNTDGHVGIKLVRNLAFPSQTEGMVVDEKRGQLFVGEENKGVWKTSLDPHDIKKEFIQSTSVDNDYIVADVEGITLASTADDQYLIVSSQGNFSYGVFSLKENGKHIFNFKIVDSDRFDGVEETDGLDVVTDSLSPAYPEGLVVFQDGFNFDKGDAKPQNFKYVSWREIRKLIDQKISQ